MSVAALLAAGASSASAAAARRACALTLGGSARRRARSVGPPGAGDRLVGPNWRMPSSVSRLFDAAGVDPPAQAGWWRLWVLCSPVCAAVSLMLWGPAPAALLVAAWVVSPATWLWSRRDVGAQRYDDGMAGALEGVAAALRTGSSLTSALASAALDAPPAIAADLTAIVQSVARGAPLKGCIEGWAQKRPVASVRITAAVLATATDTGGRLAGAVEAVAESVRDRGAVRSEARALATQARASAWVMGVLPILFAAASATLDSRVAHTLLETPLGLACLGGGLAFDGVAALWMARVTRAAG